MTGFVLDCSIAASWCFKDQATPQTDRLLDRARRDGAAVPALWSWEVANILTIALRRARITPSEANACLWLFALLPISIDAGSHARAWRETFQIAQAHKLTAYDAAYLELALRLNWELATRDAALIRAAGTLGVTVLP